MYEPVGEVREKDLERERVHAADAALVRRPREADPESTVTSAALCVLR
jgi:hypothetical protein